MRYRLTGHRAVFTLGGSHVTFSDCKQEREEGIDIERKTEDGKYDCHMYHYDCAVIHAVDHIHVDLV